MYKVLIVEDDPMVAMINEQYIMRHKEFTVVKTCSNGNSALEYLNENSVDLVVLDVFMPCKNGFEMLRQIRERQISVDVIMVTAANERESLMEALRLGVVDYLVKPFAFERFRMALDKFIAKSDAFRGLDRVSQKNIDFYIKNASKNGEESHPKGVQERTLQLIVEYLKKNNEWQTGDEIAEQVGLTGVTVRRYMTYLTETGAVISEMNYETGGRPCLLYKFLH